MTHAIKTEGMNCNTKTAGVDSNLSLHIITMSSNVALLLTDAQKSFVTLERHIYFKVGN